MSLAGQITVETYKTKYDLRDGPPLQRNVAAYHLFADTGDLVAGLQSMDANTARLLDKEGTTVVLHVRKTDAFGEDVYGFSPKHGMHQPVHPDPKGQLATRRTLKIAANPPPTARANPLPPPPPSWQLPVVEPTQSMVELNPE